MNFIKSVQFKNLRLFKEKKIEFSPQINGVFGSNGSGKTSILEALYLFSHGRSFRAGLVFNKLIQQGESFFSIKINSTHVDSEVSLSLKKHKETHPEWFLDQKSATFKQILPYFPVQFFHVGDMSFFNVVQARRQFFDWMVYRIHPDFLGIWLREQKILKQRNCLLQRSSGRSLILEEELSAFDQQLAPVARQLTDYRETTFTAWLSCLKQEEVIQSYLDQGLKVNFYPGWDLSRGSLEQQLKSSLEQDMRLGYTTLGSHRFDIKFSLRQDSLGNACSRGQLKMILLDVFFSRLRFLEELNLSSIFLLDDLLSELDSENTQKILERITVNHSSHQVIFTSPVYDKAIFDYAGLRVIQLGGKNVI